MREWAMRFMAPRWWRLLTLGCRGSTCRSRADYAWGSPVRQPPNPTAFARKNRTNSGRPTVVLPWPNRAFTHSGIEPAGRWLYDRFTFLALRFDISRQRRSCASTERIARRLYSRRVTGGDRHHRAAG